MTARTRRRPPSPAGGRAIGWLADHRQATASSIQTRVPYDAQSERYVLAAVIAGPDLSPRDVDPADMYVPSHARIAAALRLLDRCPRRWLVRVGGGPRWHVDGLDAALVTVGSPDVAADLRVADSIAGCDPGGPYLVGGRLAGGPHYHVARVADLAARRRRLAELDVERELVLAGVAS